jgi:HAD superfamily hydrolase (TIGR01450 family)
MKAVVLAAGIGSRLSPLTLDRPKSCISVDGIPILEHQLRSYATAGVEEVYIVAGYMADQVRALCETVAEREDISISVVENEAFPNTDNMYSLYCVRDTVAGEPFLLSNGDVVFDYEVTQRLCDGDGSAVASDFSRYDEEAMKISLDGKDRIQQIAKDINSEEAAATSIDVYRFSAAFSRLLFEEIRHTIEVENNYTSWTEAAIDDLVQTRDHDLGAVDIGDASWVEIDDFDDLLLADRTFSPVDDLRNKEAVFLDLDGTVYLDDSLVDGAKEAIVGLRESGVDVYFLSNNSSAWKTDYAEKLSTLGISTQPNDVILSTDGVIDYLERERVERAYVVGTDAMREAISRQGIDPAAEDPEVVVVGFDTELTYEKVRKATLAIRNGGEFLLAHADVICPTEDGFIPDCGSIGALVESATDREPNRVFGKPNADMIAHVLDTKGISAADIGVVGDRLETDIRMAEQLGCASVCVLSGEASRADIEESDLSPSLVVQNLGDLVDVSPQMVDSLAQSSEPVQESN